MPEERWRVIEEVDGSLRAEALRGFLESQGVRAMASQESVGLSTLPVTVGPLARVQILVPAGDVERARQVLADYYAGVYKDFRFDDDQDGGLEDEADAAER